MFVARNALKFQSDEKWCTNYENNKLGTYISFEMASCKYENKKITIMQQPTSSELSVQLIDFVHFIYLFFVPCEVWIELPRIVVERVPISNAFIIWVIMRTKWQHKSTGTDFGFWVFYPFAPRNLPADSQSWHVNIFSSQRNRNADQLLSTNRTFFYVLAHCDSSEHVWTAQNDGPSVLICLHCRCTQ